MDTTSRKVLAYIKASPNNYISFYSDTDHAEALGMTEQDFKNCIRHLADLGYLNYQVSSAGAYIGVMTTYIAMHENEIAADELKRSLICWLFHDFLGGVIIGIAIGVTSTLLVQHLLGL